MKGSFKCASPSTNTVDMRLYFAALRRIEAILLLQFIYILCCWSLILNENTISYQQLNQYLNFNEYLFSNFSFRAFIYQVRSTIFLNYYCLQYHMQAKTVQIIVQKFDFHKESLLKACQYLAIFLAWFNERNKTKNFNFYFSIYMKIYHSRRLFRLLKTLTYIPKIKKLYLQLRENFTFRTLFDFLGRIFTALFYALDNITIVSMIMGFVYYKTVRRISHAILFNGILFSTIALFIELRESFKQQSNLKGQLQNQSPTQLLQRLSNIDQQRKVIGIKLIKAFGDLFPTLARTNLPQIIVRTKINKGTVGFFGMISALTKTYLREKQVYIK